MAAEPNPTSQGTCFVVMGFGKKTDFETGRVLDLDKSYKNLIKPAVEACGLKCIRADEIVHSGMIDVPMYEQLLKADVVVADLSTSNNNAFYELGVRHALRPFTTVVICEDGIKKFPFDVNHVAVSQYHHMGEDIGFDETMRFRALLSKSITEIIEVDPRQSDSPIYRLIQGLTPPSIAALAATAAAAVQAAAVKAAADSAEAAATMTHSVLMQQVDQAQKKGDFGAAKALLTAVRQAMQVASRCVEPNIIQRLALVTYKSEQPSKQAALEEARDLLAALAPDTSNDTETLGLWGAVHKRLWELTRNPNHLDVSVRAYARGFYLRNDFYNGINLAYLLNIRSANSPDRAESIADFVQARRVRRKVIEVCEQWWQTESAALANPAGNGIVKDTAYWVKATLGEAYIGIDEKDKGQSALDEALAMDVGEWMKRSTQEQLGKLHDLLANSPMKYVRTDAA